MRSSDASAIVSGFRLTLIRIHLAVSVIRFSASQTGQFFGSIRFLIRLIRKRKDIHENSGGIKAVKSDSLIYWSVNIPGWPSPRFKRFISDELKRITEPGFIGLQTIILGITSSCPLNCIHCYESDAIDRKSQLTLSELKIIMGKICASGIRHIQFSGGEPLSRFDDLISLMQMCDNSYDLWINTSGFGLSEEKAAIMKKNGMTGAIISLDHWDAEAHNRFRKNERSFAWIEEAVKNCSKNGILVCLSLCPVKEFVTEENLSRYHELARSWGVGFIRIMEPRNAGRFEGKNEMLGASEYELLYNFTRKRNCEKRYNSYPIIQFPGHHQRRIGCLGSGNRYIYIDPEGNFHSCPFCRKILGNAVVEPLSEGIRKARESGCKVFRTQAAV